MHEHDFTVHDESQYSVEWGESGDVVAYIDCAELIITDSYTDSHRDEVYEESESCLSTLTRYWTVKKIVPIAEDKGTLHEGSENFLSVLNQIDLDESAMSFVEFGNAVEEGDETVLVVELEPDGRVKQTDPVEFQIVYELAEVYIND